MPTNIKNVEAQHIPTHSYEKKCMVRQDNLLAQLSLTRPRHTAENKFVTKLSPSLFSNFRSKSMSDLGISLQSDFNKQDRGIEPKLKMSDYLNRVQKYFYPNLYKKESPWRSKHHRKVQEYRKRVCRKSIDR